MSQDPAVPGSSSASSASSTAGVSVGNPKDIQGVLALTVIGGTFAIAAVAIATGVANAVQVLASVLPLAGTIIGFYYGQKSQQ